MLSVYAFTRAFPKDELYGLTSQLRRASVSIPANIAGGFKKRSKADKARFYNIAQGSIEECRYYLILAKDLGYADPTELDQKLQEVSRLLEGYIKAIQESMC